MKDRLIHFITMAVIIGVVVCGVFNIRPVGPWVRHVYYRVVGGASSAMKSSGPSRGGNPADAQKCRENLRLIESAKAKTRTLGPRAVGGVSWSEIMKELDLHQPKLLCPARGEYTLGSMTSAARCSIGGNSTPDPLDDHLIKSY